MTKSIHYHEIMSGLRRVIEKRYVEYFYSADTRMVSDIAINSLSNVELLELFCEAMKEADYHD